MPTLLEQLRQALAPIYEVERELGTGGMGTVYLARDTVLDRQVAVKVLRAEIADQQAAKRLLNEARTLARLRHPNIVSIYHASRFEDSFYYVMDYVEGETLAERLKAGPLSLEETARLGSDLLSALAAAHSEGIVHRDVKPSNVFMTGDRALLGDFGISKRLETESTALTHPNAIIGTPGYMAPEQITGEDVTSAVDIYSMGMVLYEACTGSRWTHITSRDEADWTKVPRRLRWALRRALAFAPEARWRDAGSFRRAVLRVRRRRVTPIAVSVAAVTLAVVGVALFRVVSRSDVDRRPGNSTATRSQITHIGNVGSAALSPDGRRVAYSFLNDSGQAVVAVRRVEGGNALEVHTADVDAISWSPDGSRILLRTSALEPPLVIEALRGDVRSYEGIMGAGWVNLGNTWSPDGSTFATLLVSNASDSTVHRLALTARSTGATRYAELQIRGRKTIVADPNWSPNGDWIAFWLCEALETVGARGCKPSVWVTSIDGERQQLIVDDSVWLGSPRWSPTGDAIYYLRSGGSVKDIWKIPISETEGVASGPPALLQTGLRTDHFTISSDARSLLYVEEVGHSNLFRGRLERLEGKTMVSKERLTSGTSRRQFPCLSPDGTQIAFVDRGDVYTIPVVGGPARQITELGDLLSLVAWSPDGTKIAFFYEDKLWTVDLESGTLHEYSQSQPHSELWRRSHLAWSPGARILYLRDKSDEIYALDPITEEEAVLVSGFRSEFAPPLYSPDGKLVAMGGSYQTSEADAPKRGIWIVPVAGGSPGVVATGNFLWPAAWDVDGRSVFILAGNQLSRVPVDGGDLEAVATLPFKLPVGVSMAPGARFFVMQEEETTSDLWLIENFDRDVN